MKVRVGVDGAQATGKTTLLAALQQYFGERFEYIPEASRIIAPGFGVMRASDWPRLLTDKPSLERFFDAEEEWVLSRHAAAKGSFIVDSSLWLVAAYREQYHCRSGVEVARNQKYELLLYCGPSAPPEIDGFRFTAGQREVDATYRRLTSEWFDGATVALPSGADRTTSAITHIDALIDGEGVFGGS